MSDPISKEVIRLLESQGWSLVGSRLEKDGSIALFLLGSGGLCRVMSLDRIKKIYNLS